MLPEFGGRAHAAPFLNRLRRLPAEIADGRRGKRYAFEDPDYGIAAWYSLNDAAFHWNLLGQGCARPHHRHQQQTAAQKNTEIHHEGEIIRRSCEDGALAQDQQLELTNTLELTSFMLDPAIQDSSAPDPSLPSKWVTTIAIAFTALFVSIPIFVLQDPTLSLWPPRILVVWFAVVDLLVGLLLTGYRTFGYAIRAMYVLLGKDTQKTWGGSLFGISGKEGRIAVNLGIGYLLVVYLFAVLYRTASILDSRAYFVNGTLGSLSFFDAFYFSITTASTVGFGDITPASVWAKSLVMVEIILSLAYAAFLLSVGAARLMGRKAEG